MARLTGNNIEQFRSGNGSTKIDYLSLKEDKETAKIRLLYNNVDDIEGIVVHRVKVGEWDLPVYCLLEPGSPIDDCPFCREHYPKQARIYIPVFDETDCKFKFWDRPNSFYSQLSGQVARTPNTVSQVFEIERSGKKGSNRPGYSFYPQGQPDGTTIDDILDDCGYDKLPDPVGTKILDKSADDMEYYIRNGEFPSNEEAPVRRRSREEDEDMPPRRRSRGGDRF